jgi:hypothetical protein
VKICGLEVLAPFDEDIDFSYVQVTVPGKFQLFFNVRE